MQISFTKRKVHYLYLTLAIVSIFLAIVSYARAQESLNLVPAEDNVAAANAKKTERRALTQDQQNRFINLVRNAYTRMDGAVVRLDGIIVRLEARIAVLDEEGVDTGLALAPLSDAKNKLDEARAGLAQAKTNAENSIVSDTPRERFNTARTQFVNIRQAIRDSYILIREAVAELKDAVLEANLNNNGQSAAVSNAAPTSTEVTN